ncbi:MAG: hypothetical protein NTV05_02455 [Acidobacteria bacterium]|nr:hypothetical protein [Acidobacteriota bacterium]
MSPSDLLNSLGALVQGTASGAVFVLLLLVGACLTLDLFKLRKSGPATMTVRSLDEALGRPAQYLPSSTPRGVTDRLKGFRPAP